MCTKSILLHSINGKPVELISPDVFFINPDYNNQINYRSIHNLFLEKWGFEKKNPLAVF